ncbi:MAG: nitroreductase family deazaflavin-dependent oxidoreductase [Gammaproteobacteria bacterium]|nr:nitroreductase family deazaflavin-dependent oxidoreductase [Gammaproteobacteria bacterium]
MPPKINWHLFNQDIISEFRANSGRVAQFGKLPVVILHTVGARSAKVYLIPLVAVLSDDQMFIFATNAGSPRNPAWVYNLRANPTITVEYGTRTLTATASELPQQQADKQLIAQAELSSQLTDYLKTSHPRRIPVFKILPS